MKSIFIMLLLITFCNSINSQVNTYKIEEDGYLTNIKSSAFGIIATDNYASKLYLIKDNNSQTLYESPGCGRYYTVSYDGKKLGFKLIDENGQQSPMIMDIETGMVKQMHAPVDLCGQPSFDLSGNVAFTIGTELYFYKNNILKNYSIGFYANYTPISPDGKYVVFNDEHDQLNLISMASGNIIQFTDNTTGYSYPVWSPLGDRVVYNSLTGDIFVYDLNTGTNFYISHGGSLAWYDNETVLFDNPVAENFEFSGSDIFASKYDGTNILNLTNTPDMSEMNPVKMDNNALMFHTYDKKSILKGVLSANKSNITTTSILFQLQQPMQIKFYDTKKFINQSKAIKKVPGTVPYVHQVYDTPSWHSGWGSCAPTTSVMAFAYYNRLPKWPTEVDHGYSWDPHVNNYGSYVADRYRFREVYYEETADAYGTTAYGGYGYMWTDPYSPNSRMKQYIINHGMTSNQLWTTSCTYTNTTSEIDQGYVHPICNYLTSSGHLTLAIGYITTQHTLIFNDPYGNKNTPGYPSYDGADSYYDWPTYSNGYQNLDASGTHGYVAWTVKAQTTEPVYNDTIIDDNYYDHGFYMFNQAPSHQRYYRSQLTGYNGHVWWTGSMNTGSDICYCTWTPTLAENGDYEVLVYIPSNYATANGARYKIHSIDGDSVVVINQSLYSNEWVSLGTYKFQTGQDGYVYLGDYTGITAGEMLAFDAVWFKKIPPQVQIVPQNVSCNGLSDGLASASVATGTSPYSYLWNTTPAQTTATASNLAAGIYTVTVTDANSIEYIGSVTITEPSLLQIQYTVINPLIAGTNTGEIHLNIQGGTPPYGYFWSPAVSTNQDATSLYSGDYGITIMDSNNCYDSQQITLVDPTCDAPQNLVINQITGSTAHAAWDAVSDAVEYLVGLKENTTSDWQYFNTPNNYIDFSGLASGKQYDVQVSTLCGADTSVSAVSAFSTSALSNQVVTLCDGKFTDSGGGNNAYTDNEDYTFVISPVGAEHISVSFSEFDIEQYYDTLWIYDGASTTASLIGSYTGSTAPEAVVSTGGSLCFRFWSDYATTKSGWVANWISYGDGCVSEPVTNILPVSEQWQTQDFIADFQDFDNSSKGLKKSFYNVMDFNGSNWYSNTNVGFLNDDFTSVLSPDWIASSGTWTVENNELKQSDEIQTNTNIYIPLQQDSLYDYVYSFRMKINDGASYTTERAGFYFFVDNPTGVERGNSYLAWFRPSEKRLQLWKNINDVDYLETNDYVDFGFNTWHNVKIYYSPVSGEISVYVDDALASTWVDASAFKSGQYISLRSRYSVVQFDDIEVYKSRNSNEMITIGNDANDYIRFQNPSPIVSSAMIKSLVIDNNWHISTVDSMIYNIDWTSPENIVSINDGLGSDIDTTNSNSEISANWVVSSDSNSDIAKYWYAIGTSPGSNDIFDWMDNGLNTSFTATGIMNLTNGTIYYVSVKAQNNAGLFSDVISSDGQLAILIPTIVYTATEVSVCEGQIVNYINNTQNATGYHWFFDGGNPSESFDETPGDIIYNYPGTYDVMLIASGNGGVDTLAFENYITVHPLALASFTVSDTLVHMPTPIVLFTNNSDDADSYLWLFGDGSSSTDQNPYHIYSTTGYYSITLIAYDNVCGNDTMYIENYIHVANPVSIPHAEMFGLQVFPNPADKKIFIKGLNADSKTTISLIDNIGRKLELSDVIYKEGFIEINLEYFPAGIYSLVVKEGDNKEIENIKVSIIR